MQKFFDCGIDLGTTNSCLAVPTDDNGFAIIENQADRMSVTPSAVMFNGKGRMLVGQRAYNSQKAGDLAIQFKRQMGTSKMIHFESADLDKTPEDLSAEILKTLKKNGENQLGRSIKNVVITVPSAFKTLQSEATNKAGRQAGFQNIILLQEPIAAAVAYGAKPDAGDKYFMVFDYGGGTLDVAIISTLDHRLTVKNSEGDNYFGGSDIDRLLYREIVLKKLNMEGYQTDHLLDETTPEGKTLVRRILLDCENCKVDLSSQETAVLEIYDLDDDHGRPIEFECEIKRTDLEELLADTVEKTLNTAKKALEGAKIRANQLDRILLVGGSTFIPLVRRRLAEVFQVPLDYSLNPMTVVAAGAAIYAASSIIDEEENIQLTDSRNAVITLAYDPVSSRQTVNVIGKIVNNQDAAVEKIKIEGSASEQFEGITWTSGWMELLDRETGVFDVDVFLQKGTANYFRVTACSQDGKTVIVENPLFEIKYNAAALKPSAPPATMTISVEIWDDEADCDILYPMIRKNVQLPAQNEKTFRLSRDIDPFESDVIRIKIWEGENIQNPEANFPAGTITVKSEAMDRHLSKGTEIELTITADENRNIRVSGYIPDIDYVIPEETLRAEAKVDLQERMDGVEKKLSQAKVSLQNMKRQGMDVGSLEKSLNDLEEIFDETYRKIETDEAAVNQYIKQFYTVESQILAGDRLNRIEKNENENEETINQARHNVKMYGDEDAKNAMVQLEESYKLADTPEEKKFVADKMNNLAFKAQTDNYEWLKMFFTRVLNQPDQIYTNPQKAEYWKTQACQALDSKNVSQLHRSVFELFKLLTPGAGETAAVLSADLSL